MIALDSARREPPLPPRFAVRIQPDRDLVHLQPVGELDLATIGQVRDALDELLSAGFTHVAVDLRQLTFIDLCGLRLLLAAGAAAQRDGWRLSLIQGPEPVRRLFALTATLDALPFTSPAALANRRRPSGPGPPWTAIEPTHRARDRADGALASTVSARWR